MSIDHSFLGRGWAFPPTFSKDERAGGGRAAMAAGEDDIRQSLFILLSTAPGERVMRPEFGCGIKTHVFDNVHDGTLAEIKDLIERAILFFEPRITLNDIEVSDLEIGNGRLDISLHYTVRMTNTRSNMVYPFYFVEGSNVSP
ncbi:GPW/gp25 family protein [Janthinobacterium fluminis]|uniref:GPW/gp25 family protein n=1 Tax=Janthinobacterium fluminis TaxID=2987524 RepID=A0ABT5K5R4_9BURK|nr:GPW/gp25 family protein [Janthinobacterium fluminis]MDC8760337.1 GPW/gp25 family protein [Janthinobacterium fluminis]